MQSLEIVCVPLYILKELKKDPSTLDILEYPIFVLIWRIGNVRATLKYSDYQKVVMQKSKQYKTTLVSFRCLPRRSCD